MVQPLILKVETDDNGTQCCHGNVIIYLSKTTHICTFQLIGKNGLAILKPAASGVLLKNSICPGPGTTPHLA